MVLLDRTFLFDLFTEEPDAIAALDDFDWRDASVSLVTVTEVRSGLPESKLEEFDEIINQLDVLEYTFDEGRMAVDEHKRLYNDGRNIEPVDAMVAATAIVADEPVLTTNVSRFEPTQADVIGY